MRPAWKVLNLPHAGVFVPPLIIKYEIGTSDYTVWVTDLTLIWSESLDRKRIIRRSFDVDTSIDPSEDPDQLRLFLKGVGDALAQQPTTTLDLMHNVRDHNLLLRTFTPLPGSLKPLEWVIELLPALQSTLTAELIVPMLSQQMLANAEKASLLHQLKEKDQIIAKLTDKMQSEGIDLGRLFPGVVSKSSKAMSRQALGKSVKGLGEFDEHQWRSRLTNNVASSKEFIELVTEAFNVNLGDQPEAAQIPEHRNWWEKLSHKNSQSKRLAREFRHTGAEERFTQEEFQRQSTPTKLRTSSPSQKRKDNSAEPEDVKVKARKQPHANSDSTTDESDQELRSPWPKSIPLREKSLEHNAASIITRENTPISPQSGSGKKVGHEAEQDPMRFRGADISKDHDSSSDGHGTHAGSREVESGTPDQIPASKLKAPKLGRVGGKGNVGKTNKSHAYASHIPPTLASSSSPSGVSFLSTDVGALARVEAGSERGSRTAVQSQAPSPPRETSQERANRNREKLKRELETKSHAGVKKKRKF